MTKISVIIPWREQPSRTFAYHKLIEWYSNYFPNLELISSDSDTQKFELARARNLGAEKAIAGGADILVFNDADAFAYPQSLQNAIAHAESFNEVALPYSVIYQHKNSRETTVFFKKVFMTNSFKALGRVMNKPTIMDDGLPKKLYPCSLITVFPSSIFKELGGFNENIKTWGPEDTLIHRQYFDKYNKLFTYVDGAVHTTHNDPSVRKVNPEYQEYYKLSVFGDKR
jgi:predicted glycosyltransferase involved in capsule biosynthesis